MTGAHTLYLSLYFVFLLHTLSLYSYFVFYWSKVRTHCLCISSFYWSNQVSSPPYQIDRCRHCLFLDAITSPGSYPCQSVRQGGNTYFQIGDNYAIAILRACSQIDLYFSLKDFTRLTFGISSVRNYLRTSG